MRVTAVHRGRDDLFEGDRTLFLQALPPNAVVTAATIAIGPTPHGGSSFEETITFGEETHGATMHADSAAVEVDFHARRTLVSVSGDDITSEGLQVDLGGGVFVEVGENGVIRSPDQDPYKVPPDGALPGLTVTRMRLTGGTVTGVTVRSVPTNISARVGSLPPVWVRTGELTREETSPDFAAVLQAVLVDAAVVKGSYRVPVVIHSDALCRLNVRLTIDYVSRAAMLPNDLQEATFNFDHSSAALPNGATLGARVPAGATVAARGTAGTVVGAFDPTRIVSGSLGVVQPSAAEPVGPLRAQAQPVVLATEHRVSAIDVLLSAGNIGADIELSIRADADGTPWGDPLLAKPVPIRIDPPRSHRPTWVSAPVPGEFRFEAGVRYWIVLQSLVGEARWSVEPTTPAAPGLQSSSDGGLSWHAATANADGTPVCAFLRIRKTPPTFTMPIRLMVGNGRMDIDDEEVFTTPGTNAVSLERFAPLGRLEVPLHLDELGAAIQAYLDAGGHSRCPEIEHLANGDFVEWSEVSSPDNEDFKVVPARWIVTSGTVLRPRGSTAALLGAEGAWTSLSQVVSVAGGCSYRLRVRSRSRTSAAVVEILWRRADATSIQVDSIPLADDDVDEFEGVAAEGYRGLTIDAPAEAVQAEVRIVAPPRRRVEIDRVSLMATTDEIGNGDFLENDGDAVHGWTLTPAEDWAQIVGRDSSDGIVFANPGNDACFLTQRIVVSARGPYELEVAASSLVGDATPPTLQLTWLHDDGEPAGPPVTLPLIRADFEAHVLRGEAPADASHCEFALVVPPRTEHGAVEIRSLSLRFVSATTVPLNFLGEAPGDLTISHASVLYDLAPQAAPRPPPGGLFPPTPRGHAASPEPFTEGHCHECGDHHGMEHAERVEVGLTSLEGVGEARAAALERSGIRSIDELAAADPEIVARLFGWKSPAPARRIIEAAERARVEQ